MILIALGANLPGPDGGTPLQSCEAALAALRDLPGLAFVAQSPWYCSAPIPASDQPPFINGVARLSGSADPAWLLAALHRIEDRLGRRRSVANAARTLDLDLIALNDIVRASPDPILPHPRAGERAFVLRPIADVAPDWRHPVLGQTAAALLRALPPQAIERL